MADKNVVREDVVQIGFEVDDGLSEIQGQLDALLGDMARQTGDLVGDMGQMGQAARGAAGDMGDLVNNTRGIDAGGIRGAADAAGDLARGGQDAAGNMGDIGDQARQTTKPLSQMAKEAAAFARTKFAALTSSLKKVRDSAVDRVMSGVTRLKAGFAGLQNVRLGGIAQGLDKGLGLAVTGAKKLLGAVKSIAGVGLEKLKTGLKTIGAKAAEASGKIVKGLGTAGVKAVKGLATGALAAGAALGGLMGAATKVGMDFEAGMSQVAATMGITKGTGDFTKLSAAAKEAGATTQFSATQSSEALNYLALAGYDADKAVAALPSVLSLAAAGGMELATASDMVTDSMSALGIEATQDNLNAFSDQLAKTAQKSNTSVQQLGEAVLTVGGTAKMLQGGTTEMNALLGIIADNGVKGAEGGTKLRNMILSLTAPTDVASKQLKKLGVSVFDAQGEMRPMNEIMGDLNKSLGSMTAEGRSAALSNIFNKADLKSVNALLANSGARYNELAGYIEDSEGACKDMAATMNDNLKGALTTLGSAAEGLGIAVYENVDSPLKATVEEATGWVGELTKAVQSGGVDGLVGAVGSILAKVVNKVAGAAPKLVTAGMGIIRSLLSGVQANAPQIARGAASTLTAFITGIVSLLPSLLLLGVDLITQFAQSLIGQLPQMLVTGAASLATFANGIAARMPALVQTATQLIRTLVGGLIQNLPSLIQSGITMVGSLLMGVAQMLPVIVEQGLQLIIALAMGLIENLPAIVETAGQIIVTLAVGLIKAIPQLILAVPKLVGALVDTILHTNWLKVGWDIISGIGKGILDGIKGLFGGGKDAGEETAEGAAEGLTDGLPLVADAAQNTASILTDGLQPDNAAVYGYGTNTAYALSAGLDSQSGYLYGAANALGTGAADALGDGMLSDGALESLKEAGLLATDALGEGLYSGTPADAARRCGSDTSAILQSALAVSAPEKDLAAAGTDAMTALIQGMDTTAPLAGESAQKTADDVLGVMTRLDLTDCGKNAMAGFARGITAMSGKVLSAAGAVARSVKSTVNAALDIHSPSRVMEESGEHTGQGLVRGLDSTRDRVQRTAGELARAVAAPLSMGAPRPAAETPPAGVPAVLSPEYRGGGQAVEHNTYAPVFNLTINGADDARDMERKVKRWVKQGMNEVFESMGRRSPALQEV